MLLNLFKKNNYLYAGAFVAAIGSLLVLKKISELSNEKHTGNLSEEKRKLVHFIHQNNFFINKQNLWIYFRKWEVIQPKAMVFLIHGAFEHIGRYEHVALELNKLQISVYGLDHQGHGQSDGDAGYVERFSDYIDDIIQFVHYIQSKKNEKLPSFLVGHSMGGLLTMRTILAEKQALHPIWEWNGFALFAPAVALDPKIMSPTFQSLIKFISNFFPKLGLEKLNVNQISRMEPIIERQKRDKLVYQSYSKARWANEFIQTIQYVKARYALLSQPALIIHGQNDRIIPKEGSEEIYQNISSLDKEIFIYPNVMHEVLNDEVAEDALHRLGGWVLKHL